MILSNKAGLVIQKLMLFPTPTGVNINKGCVRGYVMNANNGMTNKLKEAIHDNSYGLASALSKQRIAEDFSSLVGLNKFKVADADIVNGWGTRRIRFMLQTVEEHTVGSKTIHFFNGYTSYYDGLMDKLESGNFKIDAIIPLDMEFHINSVTTIASTVTSSNQVVNRLISKVNIIKDINGATAYEIEGVNKTTISPSDIFTEISLSQQYKDIDASYGGNTPNESKMLNMKEGSSVDYADAVVNSLVKSKIASGTESVSRMNETEQMIHIAEAASTKTKNSKFSQYGFFMELYKLTGDAKPTSFTLFNLLKVDPMLDNKVTTKIVRKSPNINFNQQNTQLLESNELSDSSAATLEAVKATEFLYMLTPTMFDRNITGLTLFMSNIDNKSVIGDGKSTTILGGYSDIHETFASVPAFNAISEVINGEILSKLEERESISDFIPMTIMAEINLNGLSTVTIDLYGRNKPEIFRFDSSADSLTTPLVTSQLGKNTIVNDVAQVMDII